MDKAQLRQILERQGFHWETIQTRKQPKMTFYRPDGEALPNLPADANSIAKYLERGLSLVPPPKTFTCETCGKSFDTRIALAGHSRSHKT